MAMPRAECAAEPYQQTRRRTVASGAEERDIVIGNAGLRLPTLPTRGRNRIENLVDTIMTGGRTQIMNDWKPENLLPIAADSIDKLRGCDVFRLLEASQQHYIKMIEYLLARRPDLTSDIASAEWEIDGHY
jgi:hypothetical protein